MPENITYPYSDDNMEFDETLGQYLLTEEALLRYGVDLRARLSATAATASHATSRSLYAARTSEKKPRGEKPLRGNWLR